MIEADAPERERGYSPSPPEPGERAGVRGRIVRDAVRLPIPAQCTSLRQVDVNVNVN